MSPNYYLFIFFVWVIYFLNNFYLEHIKTRRLPKTGVMEKIFMFPNFLFICISVSKIILVLFFGFADNGLGIISGSFLSYSRLIGLVFCLVAISLFIYVIHFEKSFPSCASVSRGETPSGIYNYIRHPSYVVFFFITFGTALYLEDILLFIFACINHVSLYLCYFFEEKRIAKNNPHYKEYLKKTKRFLPTFFRKNS